MHLRRCEIQKVYLDIQSSLGVLIDNASKSSDQEQLRRISVQLVNIKRNMIGVFDEVDTENLPV